MSMNMSRFITPSKNLENLKDILPPFQSPWRSATRILPSQHSTQKHKSLRKSMGRAGRPRVSGHHRPRLSRGLGGLGGLGGVGNGEQPSSGFVRTPLKSGKRLSSIIAPVQFQLHLNSARKSMAATGLGLGTPRASLDDVYEEVCEFIFCSLFSPYSPHILFLLL
jgi:hypothetical protein